MVSRKKVLIIEDQQDFLRIYTDLLKSKGYEVVGANDGLIGWELIQKTKPDLVLLDLVLPSMHGFTILEKMKARPETATIPVIIFSVQGEGENIQKAISMGAVDFAIKGYTKPSSLISKIEAVIGGGEAQLAALPYEIAVQNSTHDAPRLLEHVGLQGQFLCPSCNQEVILKLIPDNTRQQEHWFLSHFYCHHCQKIM